jgi:ArsR family transcriptional regulator, nickel/cobalt-responsive transcriptional repressor
MGLVTGARNGRSVIYALYDNHVAMLLDEAVYHIEHLRLGVPDEPSATA